jgi:hypothetical protein
MTLDILLLLALPASGKSELRRYLSSLDRATARDDLHLGPTAQLDDYPYVHMMRRIAEEVGQMGEEPIFFRSSEEPFLASADWGTLIRLVNFDFADLIATPEPVEGSAARWLFDRIDTARDELGVAPVISKLPPASLDRLADALEDEARALIDEKNAAIPDDLDGKTIVIEIARGGPEGAEMPLPAPYGYEYALSQLSSAILERAAILYVWVDPEESRRRNVERAVPGRDGDASILNHGVPEAVMRNEYGTDDLMWLLARDGGSAIEVRRGDRTYAIPTGVFDNRADLTSFLRADESEWSSFELRRLHRELVNATAGLRV